ncbi:T9SS type A sorting domain-containing protein, partial [Bacteroidota bacterium]|nr:T9SS type A sorting domain-containing protein [Bacteroidota bacterium]
SSYFNYTASDSISFFSNSFDTISDYIDNSFYTISANSFNITDATSIIFTFRARDMNSSDRWEIYDENGNLLINFYDPENSNPNCNEYSFAYEASSSQMSSWTSDGTLNFQVRPVGFSSSLYCIDGDYITASLGQSDKLTYWSSGSYYYLYFNNLPQLNESLTFDFNFISYNMIGTSSDYWQIYDEYNNLIQTVYGGYYYCNQRSFSYTASASQVSSWSADGQIRFRVRPYGFSWTSSCNNLDFMQVSIMYADSSYQDTTSNTYLEDNYQISNIGDYSLFIRADGSEGTICDIVDQGDTLFLEAPQGGFISSIDFASYGTPSGSCNDLSTTFCHIPSSVSIVESYCLGQTSCAIPAVNTMFGDPCTGINKKLAVKATYSYYNTSNLKNMPIYKIRPKAFEITKGNPIITSVFPNNGVIGEYYNININSFNSDLIDETIFNLDSIGFDTLNNIVLYDTLFSISEFRIILGSDTINGNSDSVVFQDDNIMLCGNIQIPIDAKLGLYKLQLFDYSSNAWLELHDAFEINMFSISNRIVPNYGNTGDSLELFITGSISDFTYLDSLSNSIAKTIYLRHCSKDSCEYINIPNTSLSNFFYNYQYSSYGFSSYLSISDSATLGLYDLVSDNDSIIIEDAFAIVNHQIYPIGCTDSSALNFDPLALIDDGLCSYFNPTAYQLSYFLPANSFIELPIYLFDIEIGQNTNSLSQVRLVRAQYHAIPDTIYCNSVSIDTTHRQNHMNITYQYGYSSEENSRSYTLNTNFIADSSAVGYNYLVQVFDQNNNSWHTVQSSVEFYENYFYPSIGNAGETINGQYTNVLNSNYWNPIYIWNSTFSYGSYISFNMSYFLVSKDSSTILPINSIDTISETFNFDIPIYASHGYYDLLIFADSLLYMNYSNSFYVFNNGCQDSLASNYNPYAAYDDGSCIYCNINSSFLISSPTDSSSCDGAALSTISSNYTIESLSWMGYGDTTSLSNSIYADSLCNGMYIFSAVDSAGCSLIDTLYIGTFFPYFGCTDPLASNYNSLANINDSSCCYLDIQVSYFSAGSTSSCLGWAYVNVTGLNSPFNFLWSNLSNNTYADSLCDGSHSVTVFDNVGCSSSFNFTISSTSSFGCMDSLACNYDSLTLYDDGTCDYSCFGCTDPLACNYDSSASVDDGSCFYLLGCTDPLASNYNPNACISDSSCIYSTSCSSPSITGLGVSNVIHDRATLTFDDMNSSSCRVDQLRIKYREVGTSAWSQKNMGSPTGYDPVTGICNSTSRTDKLLLGLNSNTTYEWQMRVWYCSTGNTPWVNGPNFTTLADCPNVGNLSVTTPTSTKATFTWDNSNGAYSFVRLQGRVDTLGSSFFNIGGVGVPYGTYTKNKNGLVPGTTYRAKSRTWCDPNGGAYKAPSWTSFIYFTMPGSVRLEQSTIINDLDIYPNPSRDVFNISFKTANKQDITLRIRNIVGEEIYKEELNQFDGTYTKEISLENYPKAVYFLEINTTEGTANKKLILQ